MKNFTQKLIGILAIVFAISFNSNSQEIGEIYEGGYIFQINEDGTGLVADLQDLGQMNWNDAMSAAESATSQSYDGWYLPSSEELTLMYSTIGYGAQEGDVGNFEHIYYWSSSVVSDNGARYVHFGNGLTYAGTKNISARVRIVRAVTFEVSGCIDASANNFNADANTDDGSCCYYEPVSFLGNLSSYENEGFYHVFLDSYNGNGETSNGHNTSMTINGVVSEPSTYTLNGVVYESSMYPVYNPNVAEGHITWGYSIPIIPGEVYDWTATVETCSGGSSFSQQYTALNEISGCADMMAINYNPNATDNDGSCEYLTGCLDASAINFNPDASIDNGSCEYLTGCMNENAANYDPSATQDNGSCIYALSLQGIIDFTVPSGGSDGKAIHLIANQDIDDLSVFGLGVANNGGGSDGMEYTFVGSANAGDDILIVRSEVAMYEYFADCFNEFEIVLVASSAISQNGDDAIELFKYGQVIETFGNVNVDGTGQEWEYLDSWAYKFGDLWFYGGVNCTDDSQTSATSDCPYPICSDTPIEIINGCTDVVALNYNPSATVDNGACEYLTGCMDPIAINYNPDAVMGDDSCEYLSGCMDPNAINYNPDAGVGDDSCEYLSGCMDPNAINYNPDASMGDGSCEYTAGCMDPSAINFNPDANIDDGSCGFSSGCIDSSACNYNSEVEFDDGSCEYASCLDECGLPYGDNSTCTDCAGVLNGASVDLGCGCNNPAAQPGFDCDGNPLEFFDDDTVFYELSNGQIQTCTELVQLMDSLYNPGEETLAGLCSVPMEYLFGPLPGTFGDYCQATCYDLGYMVEVSGCMDSSACNYNSEVEFDDASCEYDLGCGCNNPAAQPGFDCDGNPLEFFDDDTVFYELTNGVIQTCTGVVQFLDSVYFQGEENLAGLCSVPMEYLFGPLPGTFGDYCQATCYYLGYVSGCMDSTAFNYDELANTDDGSCISWEETVSNLQADLDAAMANQEDGISQSDVDAAYLAGAASVTPEDGVSQADVDSAYLAGAASVELPECEQVATQNMPLDLPQGWSMFGYTCLESLDVVEAFSDISDYIEIVKDEWGLAYLPAWGFSAFDNLEFGEGYQIKMIEELTDFQFCTTIAGGASQEELDAAYAEGAASIIPEDGFTQSHYEHIQAQLDSVQQILDELQNEPLNSDIIHNDMITYHQDECMQGNAYHCNEIVRLSFFNELSSSDYNYSEGALGLLDMCFNSIDYNTSEFACEDLASQFPDDLAYFIGFSDYFIDECGVYNGDNSSCTDCAGVINGSSLDIGCGCDNIPENGYDCSGNLLPEIGDELAGGIVFKVNIDGTGLIAIQVDDIQTDWQNAMNFASNYVSSDGYDDWVLPNIQQLQEISQTIGNFPSGIEYYDPVTFHSHSGYYWSSTIEWMWVSVLSSDDLGYSTAQWLDSRAAKVRYLVRSF